MTQKMDREAKQMKTDDIYENADAVRGKITLDTGHSIAARLQPPELTGCNSMKIRSSRAALVCLVLLCVLLLTAVIVLAVTSTQERQQLIFMNENLTRERDQLLIKISNLTEEKDQQLVMITNQTEEKEQLLTKITILTDRNQLIRELLMSCDGWIYYRFSLYFISSEKKNWTESRRYCTEKGADLIIINNTEEQYIVEYMIESGRVHVGYHGVWIGLTDIDKEDTWKWVDGTNMTFRFWDLQEPNGHRGENCVLTYSPGWADYPCNDHFHWICEKTILPIVLP